MKKWLTAAVSLAVCAAFRPGIANAQLDASVRDLGAEARGVFANKCAICHGPDLAKPKGRFGYVLDLRRVAGNPEMVIPQHPDESELWVLIRRGEMPPPDSPQGELTTAQKEIIRTWIAAGAPDASPDAMNSVPPIRSELIITSTETSSIERVLHWLGKFHLLLLHFPIALVFAASVGESWSMWKRNPIPSETVRFCLWLGALAAIPTAVLGWLFAAAGNGAGSPQLLMAHRWLGTTAAVWLVVTAVLTERDARRGVRSLAVRILLMSGALIVTLTAHVGGLLARGKDFFAY
jgi:mono/diheme cytochrome c family protein/uncharacterized membrane protein